MAVAAGLAYAGVVLERDPRLALDEVGVAGAQRSGSQAVIAAAALQQGGNVWLLDTRGAVQRVEQLPWVASATVHRAWPNRVSIAVTERTPVVRLALDPAAPNAGTSLVDTDGRVLDTGAFASGDAALPMLVIVPQPPAAGVPGSVLDAPEISQALDAERKLRALGVRITEIRSEPIMGISAVTISGVRVVFGDIDGLERKVALFNAIAQRIARPQDVAYVDVRSTSAPTVQYRR